MDSKQQVREHLEEAAYAAMDVEGDLASFVQQAIAAYRRVVLGQDA